MIFKMHKVPLQRMEQMTAKEVVNRLWNDIKGVLAVVPRKVKIALVTGALMWARARYPGVIPEVITPELILTAGGVLVGAHTLTDIASIIWGPKTK